MSQEFFCFVIRTGDDVNTDQFSNAAGCDGTRFSRGFHGTHIAANQDGQDKVRDPAMRATIAAFEQLVR